MRDAGVEPDTTSYNTAINASKDGLLRSELGIGSSMLWDLRAFQDSWSFALYLLHAMALDEVPPVAWMRSIETNVCSEIT